MQAFHAFLKADKDRLDQKSGRLILQQRGQMCRSRYKMGLLHHMPAQNKVGGPNWTAAPRLYFGDYIQRLQICTGQENSLAPAALKQLCCGINKGFGGNMRDFGLAGFVKAAKLRGFNAGICQSISQAC